MESFSTITVKVGDHPYNIKTYKNLGFVTNALDDSLSVIDLKKKQEFKKIRTGENPENLDINIEFNLLVVTNWGSDSVSIYDLKNLTFIKEIKTGTQSRSFGDFILQ